MDVYPQLPFWWDRFRVTALVSRNKSRANKELRVLFDSASGRHLSPGK